ncbi:11107_t:CDS:2 [Paraglomus brasilianum]|uniref:11107_t:CDS:1 n=1 Tax=Paraglomus brasilianum TaxID=144538 RepID=A0A9N8WK91_9GLOM|nr:11107_t:CDS:2 [Paraglomus brasilianum]
MSSMDSNDIYFYQPPSQAIFPSDTSALDYNNDSTGHWIPLIMDTLKTVKIDSNTFYISSFSNQL